MKSADSILNAAKQFQRTVGRSPKASAAVAGLIGAAIIGATVAYKKSHRKVAK